MLTTPVRETWFYTTRVWFLRNNVLLKTSGMTLQLTLSISVSLFHTYVWSRSRGLRTRWSRPLPWNKPSVSQLQLKNKKGNNKEQGPKKGRDLFPQFKEDSISSKLRAHFYAELLQFLQQDRVLYALSVLLVKIMLTSPKSMSLGNFCGFLSTPKNT